MEKNTEKENFNIKLVLSMWEITTMTLKKEKVQYTPKVEALPSAGK